MNNKRNLIKIFSAGAVWSTPIVQSVVLPVHAQTSELSIVFTSQCSDSPDDQFYTISFPNEPAQSGDIPIVTGPSAIDPGNPSGDTMVFRATHQVNRLRVEMGRDGFPTWHSLSIDCDETTSTPSATFQCILVSGSTFPVTHRRIASPGSPMIEIDIGAVV